MNSNEATASRGAAAGQHRMPCPACLINPIGQDDHEGTQPAERASYGGTLE